MAQTNTNPFRCQQHDRDCDLSTCSAAGIMTIIYLYIVIIFVIFRRDKIIKLTTL